MEEKYKSYKGFCNVFKSDNCKTRKYGKLFKYQDIYSEWHLVHNTKEICVSKYIGVFAEHFEYLTDDPKDPVVKELWVPKDNNKK